MDANVTTVRRDRMFISTKDELISLTTVCRDMDLLSAAAAADDAAAV